MAVTETQIAVLWWTVGWLCGVTATAFHFYLKGDYDE